jgi:arylsulfatase A-like enzyme
MKLRMTNRIINPLRLMPFLLSLFIGLSGCGNENTKIREKPNILLIFTDQQNASMLSAAGNKDLNTPAMDFLANQGMRFSQAYCTSPVCGPARSSIVSGRMPHETGVDWNGQSMKEDVLNTGEIFRSAGYQTVWGGKWHLPESYPYASQKTIRGFDVLPFWDRNEKQWFLGAETDPPLTKAAVNYINNYDKKKPLFLAISYHNPHDICFYPRKAGWVSENDSLLEVRHYGFKHKLPAVVGTHPDHFDDLPSLPFNHEIDPDEPEFITEKRKNHHEYGVETQLANTEFGEKEWQGYLNAYNKLTELVDIEISQVLDALKSNGMWENTMIVFTSDHGDGAAAHKWAAKLSLYEESSKIPMIVVYPGEIPAGKSNETHPISQIDILPTMLDYAQIEPDVDFTGKSLRTIIEDPTANWRDFVVVELADFKPDPTRKGRMLRKAQYKYNIYSTGEEQLFNLRTDPGEMQNLNANPEFSEIREDCRNRLKLWAESTNDDFALQILAN